LLLEAVGLIYLELLFVTAVATFFSTFATPVMSIVFTLALWFIGHMAQSLRQLGMMSDSPSVKHFFEGLYWILPDLAKLTQVRGDLMYGHQLQPELFF